MRSLLFAALIASSLATTACVRRNIPEPPTERAGKVVVTKAGAPLLFSFESLDSRPFSSEAFANRYTVIALCTTYDVASTVQSRVLGSLGRHHSPRINVAVLVLEPPENRPLVEAYAKSLGLTFPIAMSDRATIAGQGPFAGLHHVPSIVILDRRGREVWRQFGLADEAVLEAALKSVEGSSEP